jgi:hypothetical protein
MLEKGLEGRENRAGVRRRRGTKRASVDME